MSRRLSGHRRRPERRLHHRERLRTVRAGAVPRSRGVLVLEAASGAGQAAAAWYVLKPSLTATALSGQGVLALTGNNLTYPNVGVTRNGRGVLAFTLVGSDFYPSAGYSPLDDKVGAGDIHIAAPGADA